MDSIQTAIDAGANTLDACGDWLARHEEKADLWTVWVLVIGFVVLALVKIVTWHIIAKQHDRTDVGRSLKRQKLAEFVMHTCLAMLYGASLVIYYSEGGVVLGVWQLMVIRLLLIGGMTVAAYAGLRFVRALQHERWGEP